LDVYYARTLESQPRAAWQELRTHLLGVARRACDFSNVFDSREWGNCAGLWHDLGKYSAEFQAKLAGAAISAEHSGVGAALAVAKHRERGLPLAFAIAGHHAGLADLHTGDNGLPKPLKDRLKDNGQLARRLFPVFPREVVDLAIPELPNFLRSSPHTERNEVVTEQRRIEFWTRFLFSALVDADRLDSEEFCEPEKANRRGGVLSIATLQERIDSHIAAIQASLSNDAKDLAINRARQQVVEACREAAGLAPGNFSLTVPTGGGKTLSAMSFALRHAMAHGLRRVIVVIPYTSIIEQNARVYRQALGRDAVVEHHSNLDPKRRRSVLGEEVASREEMASENWDAPVIVTTTVQFFESLFSNRPSVCRKLHNVARSVIILDEVQTLPPAFLQSVLDALNELVRAYHCSVVLATATLPALRQRDRFEFGLRECREIVLDPRQLARDLQRVEYIWPSSTTQVVDPAQLAAELSQHRQVLAVVHRRQDARVAAQQLEALVQDSSVHHLSALMCPAHRTGALEEIKSKLQEGKPCRVVSTQLVEAGVDIDFPIVYRALGGLDSVAQAGGRCNREGRQEKGRVVVFRAAFPPPAGTPRRALEIAESLLKERGSTLNPDDPQLCEDYFRMLYFAEDTDPRAIQSLRQEFRFASVAREFKLIEDGFTYSVIVPYGDAPDRLEELRKVGPSRERLRGLQVFTVNIYLDAFQKLLHAGALEEIVGGICALSTAFQHLYDQKYGLMVGDEPVPNAEAMII
jgi:CRISPR-associated endonuclease/helicase Cas3